jgi:hypothetical protein
MSNMKKKITKRIQKSFYIALASVVTLVPRRVVTAQEDFSSSKIKPPLGFKSLAEAINAVIDPITKIGLVVVVLAIVYSGFLFVTAQGSDEKISKAKKTFLWVVIGAVVLLSANQISEIICETVSEFNVDCR